VAALRSRGSTGPTPRCQMPSWLIWSEHIAEPVSGW
jgi:hypothetical protein